LVSGGRAISGAAAALDVLAGVAPVAQSDLAVAVQRLRKQPAGDTIVLITGAGVDLGPAVALRATYPCVVIGMLGGDPGQLAAQPGVVVLAAPTAAEFARRWERVRRWG
jgi:hypothetical protein